MPNHVQAAAEGLPKINRRKALAVTGSGLIAALAITAAGDDKASAAKTADAELMALGEEFDRELALKAELDRVASKLRPTETPPPGAAPWDDDHSKPFHVACKSSGYTAALRVADRSHRRLDRLAKRIASIQANTIAGFAVKATGLLWSMFLWEGPFARLNDAKAFRQFVAAMRASGGVS